MTCSEDDIRLLRRFHATLADRAGRDWHALKAAMKTAGLWELWRTAIASGNGRAGWPKGREEEFARVVASRLDVQL